MDEHRFVNDRIQIDLPLLILFFNVFARSFFSVVHVIL